MRVIAIGKDDFINFYKLFGVYGIKVSNYSELLPILKRLLDSENISIVLVDERLTDKIKSELAKIKLEKPIPLMVEMELKKPEILKLFFK